MKKNGYRLIGLNLVLLMLIISAFPVFALETKEEKSTSCAVAAEYAKVSSEYLSARDSVKNVDNTEDAKLFADNESYVISVGDTSFYSNETKSGKGWTYDGNGRLELNDYVGGKISASGDLIIYSRGSVSIKGSYGGAAVDVVGNVNIITQGTFSATGGKGNEYGGEGVFVEGSLKLYIKGTFSAIGGYGNEYGGDGLDACETLYVYSIGTDATLKAIGGDGSNNGGYGGWGIGAGNVYLDDLNDCYVQGGAGENPQPAIFSMGSCEFGLINAHIKSGNPGSVDAIVFDESVDKRIWYYDEHTSFSGEFGEYFISINEYTMTLQGNGGTQGTLTSLSFKNYYPKGYYLPDYIFSRDGYTQVAWSDDSNEIVPLTAYYTPGEDVALKAEWEETQAGDILLNGIWYTFDDGNYFKKTNNEAVTLPDTLKSGDDQVGLIGWHSNTDFGVDENGVIGAENKWYMTGDTVEPDSNNPTVLYAKEKGSTACYALYHTGRASTKAGSKLIVQSASPSDLSVINAEDYMTAPDGYSLAGWATQENGSVTYNAGEAFGLDIGDVLELYAVWQLPGTRYGSGDVCAWADSKTKTIRIEPQEEWYNNESDGISYIAGAVYDENGQMISCVTISNQELIEKGFVELHYTGKIPTVAKLFTLNSNYQPVSTASEIELR